MRITVNFSLKKSKSRTDHKCPIYLRCTMHGQRFELSTGIFIDPVIWNEEKQQVKGRTEDVKILNNRLDKTASRVQDIYNQLESKGELFSAMQVKNKLRGVSGEKGVLEILDTIIDGIEGRIGNDYSEGTLKHYKTTYSRLFEFIKIKFGRKDLALSMIDFNFLNSFDLYLKTDLWLKPNTALTYHKHLKKVLNTAIAMNLLSVNPYNSFKVKRNETHRDYLTLQELYHLERKKFSTVRMEIIRDVFVFACYTGLAYAELQKLSDEHIHIGNDGEEWIIIDRTKTDIRCRIPLLPKAKVVLNKYKNFPLSENKRSLLPIHSNQKMNEYLKELATICGINKNLSMHLARHSIYHSRL